MWLVHMFDFHREDPKHPEETNGFFTHINNVPHISQNSGWSPHLLCDGKTNKQKKQAVIWRNTCKFLDMQSLACRIKLFYINTECSVLIVMIRKRKNILFLLPKCVLDGKMFGKSDGFPNSAETPSRRDFHAMMYYNYCQEKSAQQCFQSLSNCSGHHFPSWSTVHKWYKEFQFGGTIFEDWLLWPTCDRCYWTKHGQGEVADQRRSTNYRKCNKR